MTTTGLAANSSVTKIERYAFCNSSNLKSVRLEMNYTVTKNGNNAFRGCVKLTFTGLENNFTINNIEDKAFENWTNLLGDLVLNSSVQTIGDNVFLSTGYTQIY